MYLIERSFILTVLNFPLTRSMRIGMSSRLQLEVLAPPKYSRDTIENPVSPYVQNFTITHFTLTCEMLWTQCTKEVMHVRPARLKGYT